MILNYWSLPSFLVYENTMSVLWRTEVRFWFEPGHGLIDLEFHNLALSYTIEVALVA